MSRRGPGLRWHGVGWPLRRARDGARAERLAALVEGALRVDPRGVDEAWGRVAPEHRHTVVRGIVREPPTPLDPSGASEADPDARFDAAVADMARRHPSAALALGGGLDAAAVLLAWRAATGGWPTVVSVRTGVATYDEDTRVARLCRHLGAPLQLIDVPAASLEGVLREAVRVAEVPLYGWHPVVRLGLAQAVRARGHAALVTGDGADAIFRGRPDYDYVPVVVALTHAAGLEPCSPFWDPRVVVAALGRGPDPDKGWLRSYLRRRGAPSWLVEAPKRPRRLEWPAPDPTPYRPALERLASALDRPLGLESQRERLAWLTLHWLLHDLQERSG